MEREERRQALMDLVVRNRFRTQLELVTALRKRGFEVTQSSVSRDLRALRMGKRRGVYAAAREEPADPAAMTLWDFALTVDEAGDNLVVLRCQAATAQALAQEIDDGLWPGVVGTVAGDNTVFIAVRDRDAGSAVASRIAGLAALAIPPEE